MSESKTINDLTIWHFKEAFNVIKKAIETRNWDLAILNCDQGIQEAQNLKNIIWVNKFENIKQEIINLKEKEKSMDTIKHKVIVPRLEESKEVLVLQDAEVLEPITDPPEQMSEVVDDLSVIKGVGGSTELKLKEGGILTIKQLATMEPEGLAQINGFGLSSSRRIIQAAKEYFEQQSTPDTPVKNEKTPIFEKKFEIDRTSRIMASAERPYDISNANVETLIDDIPGLEPLEDVDDHQKDSIEPEFENIHITQEEETIEGVEGSEKLFIPSNEETLDVNTNHIEPQMENEKYLPSSLRQRESKLNKNQVISGFLDDTLESPQKTTPAEVQYEQVMTDIKIEFSDELLTKNTVIIMRKKTQDILQSLNYFIIPTTLPVFERLRANVDCIAIKVIPGKNDTELILIIPLKICDLKGTLFVSDNAFGYHSEQNPDLQDKLKKMLVNATMKDYIDIQSMLFNVIANDKDVFTFFRKYLKDSNISVEKGRNNQTLFLRSGLLQYKIIIEPLLLCHSLPSSLEKNVIFPYQKSTNIHFIDYAGLSSLIEFIEHKYQSLESYCFEGNAVKKYFEAKLRFIKDIRTSSIPIVACGLIFLLIVLFQVNFLINTFIGLGSAAICVYGVIIAYYYVKFAKTKTVISDEFSSPYHQSKIAIDETELIMIHKDLSTEQMDQFIYECFGKGADFKVMSEIEESKYIHSITAHKQKHRLEETSLLPKNTFTKNSKYGSFLED